VVGEVLFVFVSLEEFDDFVLVDEVLEVDDWDDEPWLLTYVAYGNCFDPG